MLHMLSLSGLQGPRPRLPTSLWCYALVYVSNPDVEPVFLAIVYILTTTPEYYPRNLEQALCKRSKHEALVNKVTSFSGCKSSQV